MISSKLNARSEKGMFFVKGVMLYVLVIILLSVGVKFWTLVLGKKLTVVMQDQAAQAALLSLKANTDPSLTFDEKKDEARQDAIDVVNAYFETSPLAKLSTGSTAPTPTIEFGDWDFTNAPDCGADCFRDEGNTTAFPTPPTTIDDITAARAELSNETTTEGFLKTRFLGDIVSTRSGRSVATYHSVIGVTVATRDRS